MNAMHDHARASRYAAQGIPAKHIATLLQLDLFDVRLSQNSHRRWTDTQTERFKQLWNDGASKDVMCSEFHMALWKSVARKAHKLGLKPRTYAPKIVLAPAYGDPDSITDDAGNYITLMTLTEIMCKWPTGDVGDTGFHFCGHKRIPGKPYCECHCRKAYEPKKAS